MKKNHTLTILGFLIITVGLIGASLLAEYVDTDMSFGGLAFTALGIIIFIKGIRSKVNQ